jgi:hypothetical protein
MAEHEPCTGASDEWFTPPAIFDALGLTFDLDPCSPGPSHWVPARRVFTKAEDGLAQDWRGALVFCNPPFGGRHSHIPWLEKFFANGNGIAICRAYTSSNWFHDVVAPRAETILFPRGKTQFVRGTEMRSETKAGVVVHPAGSVGGSPGHGVVLLGMGAVANQALHRSGLGLFIDLAAGRAAPPLNLPSHALSGATGGNRPSNQK